MPADFKHAALKAQLEGALCALLREAGHGHIDPNDMPDGIAVRLSHEGGDIEYLRGPIPVHGESL